MSCEHFEKTQKHVDKNGYEYTTITNDPTGLRLYKLKNGLTVYLAKNDNEPKIQTYIAVRAGSVYDPKDNTGLAHYLEHMLFKGTSKFGTTDWDKEKVLLQKISDLFEKHKAEKESKEKMAIYSTIDSLSLEASKISIANEYDKMMSFTGATGTNAHTSDEETVYENKIPSNELDRWIKIERERFGELVLRLFHTELEAVYEEFNRSQDSGRSRLYRKTLEALFPNHPYGQQPTIGYPEHLKNPSMVAIHDYFDKYYVPNNMAIVLVGELDFDTTIKKIDDAFGTLLPAEVSYPERPKEQPITSPIKVEITGPESEYMTLSYRSDGIGSEDELYLRMISKMLSNEKAGLIDINLNQKQNVLIAGVHTNFQNDYGYIQLYVRPKAGQTLEEAKQLLLDQIEILKKGAFEDWLPQAVINSYKLSTIRNFEDASSLASAYYNAFVHFQSWEDRLALIDKGSKLSKDDIVAYANRFFGDNYVEGHKLQGKATGLVKIDKPTISPIKLNRGEQSGFLKEVSEIETLDIQPVFLNFKEAIHREKASNGMDIAYIKNKRNDLSTLEIITEVGSDHIRELPLAEKYFQLLGTDKYSAEDIQKEFYKIGIDYSMGSSGKRSYISLSGLDENLEKGLKLLNHLLSNPVIDKEAYDKLIQNISQKRNLWLSNKSAILFYGLKNYSLHGENSKLRDIATLKQLREKNPQDLVDLVTGLREYPQRAFYYGKDPQNATEIVGKSYQHTDTLKPQPERKEYPYSKQDKRIYFSQYDMVQAQFLLLSLGDELDIDKMAYAWVFNNYFGKGLSSIIFQEMRESKSLAYSAQSSYEMASEPKERDIISAYVGTQADKLPEAIRSIEELMTGRFPKNMEQFNFSKQQVLKYIATQRITKSGVFWNYQSMKDMGIDYDIREQVYKKVQEMTFDDLKQFYQNEIANKKYTILIIGDKKDINMSAIKDYGNVKTLDAHYLFNFEK
ncbi:peptidase M16 [Elysia marginata]|uniref:Peptidase M16 n=1 Tax=Elysia marginata TaxID=1093978 RepID=A0AAV4G620_9GAST|nr:peptidase M16 [Elysia marginata]